MIQQTYSKVCGFLIITSLLFACNGSRYKKTGSGLEYKIHTDSKGAKAKQGDYLTMYLVYRSPADSVLFDSRNDGAPWHFELKKPPFQGSYEEGLTLMSAGDSASFLVSADSMFRKVFKRPLPKEIKPGEKLKFDVKLLSIESAEEAALVRRKMNEEKIRMEKYAIAKYLSAHNLSLTPTPEGLYFLRQLKSTGVSPDRGSLCVIEYTGKYLDGTEFESSASEGGPKQVYLGQRTIPEGMEEALLLMRTGERATIILPSQLAYGAEGRRNSRSGQYDVHPFTPLVYEITLRAVK